MAKPTIAIIGLGVTGASLGLALQRDAGNFEIVGHDKNPDAAQVARKQNAVQRTEWNLHRACEGAEMIVLAVPLGELKELFTQIAEDIKPGCLIFAIAGLLQPAIDAAAGLIPAHAHFVVGHPVLSGIGGSLTIRNDLFQDVTFSLATGTQTDPAAVQLASDFVERVGAKPLFVDAQEHDGILSGVEQLPQMLAAALMQMSSAAPGWREARRLAGRYFAQATEMGNSPQDLFATLQSNREQVRFRIQQLQAELDEWARLLTVDAVEGEKHPLLKALETAFAEREQWEAQAFLKQWDDAPRTPQAATEATGLFRQMFFGNLMGRRNPPNSPQK